MAIMVPLCVPFSFLSHVALQYGSWTYVFLTFCKISVRWKSACDSPHCGAAPRRKRVLEWSDCSPFRDADSWVLCSHHAHAELTAMKHPAPLYLPPTVPGQVGTAIVDTCNTLAHSPRGVYGFPAPGMKAPLCGPCPRGLRQPEQQQARGGSRNAVLILTSDRPTLLPGHVPARTHRPQGPVFLSRFSCTKNDMDNKAQRQKNQKRALKGTFQFLSKFRFFLSPKLLEV